MFKNKTQKKRSLIGKLDKFMVKPHIVAFMAYDRSDNNKFVSSITDSLLALYREGKKLSPTNISKKSGYPIREIELNLFEIGGIIDSLGLDD